MLGWGTRTRTWNNGIRIRRVANYTIPQISGLTGQRSPFITCASENTSGPPFTAGYRRGMLFPASGGELNPSSGLPSILGGRLGKIQQIPGARPKSAQRPTCFVALCGNRSRDELLPHVDRPTRRTRFRGHGRVLADCSIGQGTCLNREPSGRRHGTNHCGVARMCRKNKKKTR